MGKKKQTNSRFRPLGFILRLHPFHEVCNVYASGNNWLTIFNSRSECSFEMKLCMTIFDRINDFIKSTECKPSSKVGI